MAKVQDFDPYESAPPAIKYLYKVYRKTSLEKLVEDPNIIDLKVSQKPLQDSRVRLVASIPGANHIPAYHGLDPSSSPDDAQIYEIDGLPGKSLIPTDVQIGLLSSLLHSNLANPRHNTNVRMHHLLPYEACQTRESDFLRAQAAHANSFFHIPPDSSELFIPIDKSTHKAFTISQFFSSKLRWMTLGGQYDWAAKRYPSGAAPTFPEDIASLIHHLFPKVKPEAAIMNVYKPGDFLNMHRDVSEESDNALVSISLGCDGIFLVGLQSANEPEPRCAIIRLRSGDAVYMGGPARFAWHGLPQVIPNTCPDRLRGWPADSDGQGLGNDTFEAWRGWMANKRVNLSAKRDAISSSIPTRWKLDTVPSVQEKRDVTKSTIRKSLSQQEIVFTETDAVSIVEKTSTGQWKAQDVTKAFCRRASIAHQLTNCLHETFFDAAIEDAKKLDKINSISKEWKQRWDTGWINAFMGKKGTGQEKIFESEMVKELPTLGAVLYCKTSVPHSLMAGETVNNIIGYTTNPKFAIYPVAAAPGMKAH
ncbi:MAG: hypothetical protein Q9217_000455 [Psora testacea]